MTNLPQALDGLAAGLVLIAAFAMVATRQARAVVRMFVLQSGLLAAACFVLAWQGRAAFHLWALGGITIAEKMIAIPLVLRRLLPREYFRRREVTQAVNVPSSLLLALGLALAAEFLVAPIVAATPDPVIRLNLPIGLACLLIGAYTILARREAIPQMMGILAMENGAFLAGIAIAPDLPLIAELAVALDIVLIAAVVGVLTRAIREEVGTTAAAELRALREEAGAWR